MNCRPNFWKPQFGVVVVISIIVLSSRLLFVRNLSDFSSLAKVEKVRSKKSPNLPEEGKMPMKAMEATLSTFDGVFEKFRSESGKNKANLILFLADKEPSTGLSWCPDCVRAEPVIYKKLEAASGDVALLKAYVGDRPTWRNPHHPWRVDSRFKLRGVPTLIRWENGLVKARLEDHEAHLESKIDTLLSLD